MGNTCILCALFLLLEQNIPLYESNEELRIKHLCFFIFQDYAIKAEISLEDKKKRKKRMLSSAGKRPTTQIQVVAGKPG